MINILISVDANYLDKAQTMLYSMRMHTKEEITVFLLNHKLSAVQVDNITTYLEKECKIQLREIDVRSTPLDELPVGDYNFTIEMYYRILAQFLLPETLDRILWIDADAVLLGDISTFYHQDFHETKYVVCADSQNNTDYVQACRKRLGLRYDHIYFNSGVMLMNLCSLRAETDLNTIVNQCLRLKDRLEFPDQDILNYLYQGQVNYADWEKYNYQLANTRHLPDDVSEGIIILHYTGRNKPWNYWQINGTSRYYWKVRFKQGDRWATIKAYLLKIWDMTVLYFRELKDILF